MSAQLFLERKKIGQRISITTCYDYYFARILSQCPLDALLVGDSAAMMNHGYKTTLSATVEMMAMHTAAVSRGAGKLYVIADMPFLSYRCSKARFVRAVDKLIKAGAHALKVEGLDGHESAIEFLIKSGIPVMGHLGLTPQFVRAFGGYKVQGKTEEGAKQILAQAKQLEDLGCFSVVLECVPSRLAQAITEQVNIPTIGIGAGMHCDGQVLVLQDLLGLNPDFSPKFARKFLAGSELVTEAVNKYCSDIAAGNFPGADESY